MPEQDDILIIKAQAGDREAMGELVSAYWHPIFRLVCYKTNCPDDAQEITQETFFRAFKALPNYHKSNATFKTYLGRIALNLVNDSWRKKSRCPEVVELADYHQQPCEDSLPDEQAILQEQRAAIASVLNALPSDQRQAIQLRIIAGLPIKEASKAMGKSEAAVKMLQFRALKNMRNLMLERGIIENGEGGR